METLEYYYALASPWSFIGNQKLIEIAAAHDLTIDPIIIDYDEMFRAADTIPLPQRPILRKKYRLIDLKRWAEFRNVEFNTEPEFYEGEVKEPNEREGACMVVAAKEAGLDSLRLAHAISRALGAEERFPFTKDELIRIANTEEFDGDELGEKAKDESTALTYQANTRKSIERGVFGCHFISFEINLIGVRTVLS
ncbi:MAG: 2-hydroxychromene-2-carboxylate isomerase [Pseudomonadota bacterium]|nr:MAG: 2-hydroxychromene-2-carboxylate isomerase [Pseudomonadota bacterium]